MKKKKEAVGYITVRAFMLINRYTGASGCVLYSSPKHGWRDMRKRNGDAHCAKMKKEGWRVRPVQVEELSK